MPEVYRFTTADGQDLAWHGSPSKLLEQYPGATITGKQHVDSLGQGTWESMGNSQAKKAEKQQNGEHIPKGQEQTPKGQEKKMENTTTTPAPEPAAK